MNTAFCQVTFGHIGTRPNETPYIGHPIDKVVLRTRIAEYWANDKSTTVSLYLGGALLDSAIAAPTGNYPNAGTILVEITAAGINGKRFGYADINRMWAKLVMSELTWEHGYDNSVHGMELRVYWNDATADPAHDDDPLLKEDEPVIRTDSTLYACSGATDSPDDVYIPMPFGARLLVAHDIADTPETGGYVSVEIGDTADGVFVPHHGDGWNIPSTEQTSSYSCIYKNCGPLAKLSVSITDGTHTVWYQVLS